MIVKFRTFSGLIDWDYVNRNIPILRVQDTGGIVAYNAYSGEQVGAFVWDNVTRNSLQCHIVITNKAALRHGFFEEIANHIFNLKNKKAMYAMIKGDNEKSLKLTKKIGFTEKARLDDGWEDGIDYVMVELLKENCTYLGDYHG